VIWKANQFGRPRLVPMRRLHSPSQIVSGNVTDEVFEIKPLSQRTIENLISTLATAFQW
jgi:hypothetical protein